MNIFKTFEIFLREPLSVLRERIIQIVHVQSKLFAPTEVSVDLLDKKTQVTVVNSEKMYGLLQTVMYKQRKKEELERGISLKNHGSSNQLFLSQRIEN